MSDATSDLRAAMAAHGLQIDTVQWSGRVVRFKAPKDRGRDKSGWLVARPATGDVPALAAFGWWEGNEPNTQKWHHSNNGTGPDGGYDPEKLRRAWLDHDAELEAVRAVELEEAAKKAQALWERADPASPDHPYLKRKGVTDATGLKEADGKLLVPMRGLQKGNPPLLSIQSIDADGDKRFTYRGPGANGVRCTISSGAFKPTGTMYIVEGWVTGWSVHQATRDLVVVAFAAGNLKTVALAMRERYPQARIIIAADSDAWTGQPGLRAATEAAIAARALVTAPTFASLALAPMCTAGELDPPLKENGKHDRDACTLPHPTDFNDLHQREGIDAVARSLAVVFDPLSEAPPHQIPSAKEIVAPTGSGEVPEVVPSPKTPDPDHKERPAWIDAAPFRPIGYDHGTYFYLPRFTGQIHHMSASQHRRESLIEMADLSWWETHFPSPKGASWPAAAQAMMRACQRMGVFRPSRLRGRGCWPAEGEAGTESVILHLGDRLLAPGAKAYVDPETFRDPEARIYERLERLAGPSEKLALPITECAKVLDLFQDVLWLEEASGVLLAGWTVLAPLCAALPWRPHVWITGDSGAGKTVLMTKLVTPLLGGMRCLPEGNSTEAGIRQDLHSDGLPVVFDEAEKQDLRSDDRIQGVLALARSASSSGEGKVMKGTLSGQSMGFQIRSMFCLASIGGALRQEADKTRVSLLQLHGAGSVTPAERANHWARYAPKLANVTEQVGRELIARTLGWLRDGRLAETLRTFKAAASIVLNNARSGDQYGTLYAGAWTLMSDEAPDMTTAKELLGSGDLSDYIVDQIPAGRRALTVLLQKRERLETKDGPKTLSVGQLIDACLDRPAAVSQSDAEQMLKQLGLRVALEGGQWVLLIGTQSEWVKTTLKDTPYADSLHTALRTLPGVLPGGMIRFHAGLNSRTTAVPIAAFDS